jgi:two-component system, NtrC family, response regulator HydG
MLPEGCRIGVVEDDPVMGESLLQRLTLEGCDVDWWTTGREAMRGLQRLQHDLVICDIRLPDMEGGRLFEQAVCGEDAPPFLFITAYGEIDQAVALMRAGAGDYLTKPFAMDDFLDRVKSLLRRQDALAHSGPELGASHAMLAVERLLRRVAGVESPLLISGETGVGKEVCARFVQGISPAAEGPFMAVNCAAIPRELLESELFGHEKGSFTGAHARHLGYAERAKGGVLFLDEVADMPLPLQAKLLRLLEDRSFYRIGGERPAPFTARLILCHQPGSGGRGPARRVPGGPLFQDQRNPGPYSAVARPRPRHCPPAPSLRLRFCRLNGSQIEGRECAGRGSRHGPRLAGQCSRTA